MSTPFFRWGEFAHNPALEIFNPYVALQDWTGSPEERKGREMGGRRETRETVTD